MLAKPALACIMLVLPGSVLAQNAAPVVSTAKANPPKPAPPIPAPPKPEMATWSEASEIGLGITKDQFSSMGLSKLTNDEYSAVVGWAINREQNAAASARTQTLTYSCGRDVKQADEYDKVSVYLDIANDTPSELASRIRQSFRAIKDVQVVFSSKEADLKITVIGFELKTVAGNYTTGYAASATVTEPCISKVGTYQSDFETYRTNRLQTSGTNAGELVEAVVTSIDADEIESQRRTNAAFKKLMQTK